ncbi:MAG: alpha/beta hydrolase family protein, partial [Terriglobales bacterium]
SVPGRIYRPRGVEDPPGLVLVHGVNRLGPDDPRLVRLAEAFAATGLVVLTPRVAAFSDYRLAPEALTTIGAAASGLRRELGHPVGVVGISFAGGMALVVATDPRFASDIAFVVALGAHHDLERVAVFFATDRIQLPDGTMQPHESDQYGALVLIYADVERFFEKSDQDGARAAIRLWLSEQWDEARAVSGNLSPAAHARLEALFRHERDGVRDKLISEIHCYADELLKVSPRGKLAALRAPVFLIHGVGDKVIPTSETEWLAREIPPQHLRRALITPVLSHADLKKNPGMREHWEVVQFMRDVLVEAEATTKKG